MPVTLASPSDRLLALFLPWMAERGFTYRKEGHVFRRAFERGHHDFLLAFDGRGGLVSVTAHYEVCFTELVKDRRGLKVPEWQLGWSLFSSGAKSWACDLYLAEYAEMTPRQRTEITSETTHPQARIEAGAAFLQAAYEQYARPVFDGIQTEARLGEVYAHYLQGEKDPVALQPPFYVENAVLLALHRGDDVRPILAAAAVQARRDTWARMSLEKLVATLGIEMPTG